MGSKRSSAVHVVKPGETLYRISRQHGVSVDKIRKWNKLPDDIIEVGQKLIIGQE
jgi:LysM repeat protein